MILGTSLGLATTRHPGSKPELLCMVWTPQTLSSVPEAGIWGRNNWSEPLSRHAEGPQVPEKHQACKAAGFTSVYGFHHRISQNFLHECPRMRQELMLQTLWNPGLYLPQGILESNLSSVGHLPCAHLTPVSKPTASMEAASCLPHP